MTAHRSALGSCPLCGAAVDDRDAIIRYERSDGESAVWAECPDCGKVVDPVDR